MGHIIQGEPFCHTKTVYVGQTLKACQIIFYSLKSTFVLGHYMHGLFLAQQIPILMQTNI